MPSSFVVGSIIVILLLLAVWAAPKWALQAAIKRMNEAGETTTVEDTRNASLMEASAALTGIDHGDLLFRASPDDLRQIVDDALDVVNADQTLPVDLTAVKISPDRQAIQIASRISGVLDGGVRIDGRIHGAMTLSFSGSDLVLRTAFDRIELNSIEVPGWHWLPGGIVRLLNPAIADEIARINGALPIKRHKFLPGPAETRIVKVGNREIVIPPLAPERWFGLSEQVPGVF